MSKNSRGTKKSKYEPGQRPWRDQSTFAGGPGQKWTLWASAITLGLLGIVCLLIWVMPTGSTSTPVTAATTTSTPTAAPTSGVCPAGPSSTDIPQAAPADLQWTALYGNTWPTSATVGPTKTVDGVAQCFQHSPAGAALAGVNIMQSVRVVDLAAAEKIIAAQFVAGPGQQATLTGIQATYPTQPPQGRAWGRVVGFKIESYTAEQAVVLMVENWPQRGQYTGYDLTLKWVDGDWKVHLTDTGQPSLNGDITVDPTGFTPWEKATS
jgi:hypothetical protein